MNPQPTTTPLTLLEHSRKLSQLAHTLYGECIEKTLPDDAMKILASSVAHHANSILNLLPCCAMPLETK